jgi:hypothetical protein
MLRSMKVWLIPVSVVAFAIAAVLTSPIFAGDSSVSLERPTPRTEGSVTLLRQDDNSFRELYARRYHHGRRYRRGYGYYRHRRYYRPRHYRYYRYYPRYRFRGHTPSRHHRFRRYPRYYRHRRYYG